MSHLPYSIELHDSEVSAIEAVGTSCFIRLSHAYIHRAGKGWSQSADIVIGSAELSSEQSLLPERLADGVLRTEGGPYHNLLMLPLSETGPVELSLEFCSGAKARISGRDIEIRLLGEPVFIESFPDD